MKKYAVVFDVSPSEQLITGDETLYMGAVIGLRKKASFEEVGAKAPPGVEPMRLKKWSSGSKRYKLNFLNHLEQLLSGVPDVLPGYYAAKASTVRFIGARVIRRFIDIGNPVDRNRRGIPRFWLENVPDVVPHRFLATDLFVLGWYAEGIAGMAKTIEEAAETRISLDILIDNLPNDPQPSRPKAYLLRYLVAQLTRSRGTVVGVPAVPDSEQRDLFVDNIAGMSREFVSGTWPRRANDQLSKRVRASLRFSRYGPEAEKPVL